MRCLNHHQFFIFVEPTHAYLQEGSRWDVIAIKDRNIFAACIFQRIIDIARFSVGIVWTSQVLDANVFGKIREFCSPPVVENIDIEFVGGPINGQSCQYGRAYNL